MYLAPWASLAGGGGDLSKGNPSVNYLGKVHVIITIQKEMQLWVRWNIISCRCGTYLLHLRRQTLPYSLHNRQCQLVWWLTHFYPSFKLSLVLDTCTHSLHDCIFTVRRWCHSAVVFSFVVWCDVLAYSTPAP